MVNGEFKTISLNDYKDKWLIFFFYPLDFTFVCPTEIISFNDRADEFRKLGCELVACSCDSHFSHMAWVNTDRKDGGLGDMQVGIRFCLPTLVFRFPFYRISARKSLAISASYALRLGYHTGRLFFGSETKFSGLFLIDPKGTVRYSGCNDLPVGRSVDEALRLLKAFQFFEKNGEGRNWFFLLKLFYSLPRGLGRR